MQDADSQLVKLFLTLEMLISVKYFSANKMSLKIYFWKVFWALVSIPLCAHSRGDGGSDPVRATTRLIR